MHGSLDDLKVEVDMLAHGFFWRHPAVETVVLRPVHIVGPTIKNAPSNYLRNPQNVDVNWETLWTFKVNDWFAATLSTNLIYDGAGSNVVFDTTVLGMPENTGDAFFEGCEVVVKGRFVNQRVTAAPLEPNAAVAVPAPEGDGLVLYSPCQAPFWVRDDVAEPAVA